MSPQRIQLRRTPGWRKPEGAVVVSRPGRWGNPYVIGWCARTECGGAAKHWHVRIEDRPLVRLDTAEDALLVAVEMFRGLCERSPEFVEQMRAVLGGRDVACWCPPDLPCHGDVILEWANT